MSRSSKDARDLKKMMVGMVLIMCASGFLHVKVFSKGARAYRNLGSPAATPSAATEAGPVEGKVVVLGTDRFYLDGPEGKRWMFFFGAVEHPQLGQQVRVFYTDPPYTVTRIETP